jgi:hypothetical protein
VDRSDKVEEFMKVAIAAFELKACQEWLSWGHVHLFSRLVNEVSTDLAAAALAKQIEDKEWAKEEEEEACAAKVVTMRANLEEH